MRKIKRISIPLIIILAISAVALSPGDKYFQIVKNLDIFASLFKEVNGLYVDEVDPDVIVKTGIDAMLYSLDPYTTYIPEEDVENFKSMTTGQYAGIGAMITTIGDRVVIRMPYEDFAAYKAGLRIGDEVVAIDGQEVRGMKLSEISQLMKGRAHTDVKVQIKRFGSDDRIDVTIRREKIKVKNVPFFGMLEQNVGYIKLADFTVGAANEVSEALKKLKDEGAQHIILDVRDNPGGLLSEAVNVVNVFIPKNKIVVKTKSRIEDWNKEYSTLNKPVDTQIPLVVLVNHESASASEIVAGAIQDYDRGILIGQKTFGKGLVQTSRSLPYDAQLKITTAKYYTPSGRCIQAVDYSGEDDNGNGINIPDSLKAAFKTKGGRIVYDGEGLQPDVAIQLSEVPPIINSLQSNGLIFDYATRWHYQNPGVQFEKSEIEYQQFKSWLKSQTYTYSTSVESLIHDLRTSAQNESYYSDLQDEIKSLEKAVENDKRRDLEKFKGIILEMVEQEVASRNNGYKGSIMASFDDDAEILKALDMLKDSAGMDKILNVY